MADHITVRMSRQLASRIEDKRRRLDYYRPLGPDVVLYLHRDLRVVLTHHSNAIEGNTLDLNETRLILEEGLTVGGHPLREYIETTNHAAAFDFMQELVDRRETLDATTVLTLHLLVMQNLLAAPGSLRQVGVYIRGARWTPPPAPEVPRLLDEWLAWVAGEGEQYPPIERAAIAHSQFEAIHPFIGFSKRLRPRNLLLGIQPHSISPEYESNGQSLDK